MCDTSDLGYEALLYQAYQPFSVENIHVKKFQIIAYLS